MCRKLYSIFSEKFNYEKNKAKTIAMNLESKIDKLYDSGSEESNYIKSLKKMMSYLENVEVEGGKRDAEVKEIGKMDPE